MRLAPTFVVIAASILAPGAASAWCPPSPLWAGSTIRVRIHDQLDEQMKRADGTFWTRLELEMAVERVLLRANASAGADVPWLFLDYTTPPSTCAWVDPVCDHDINTDPIRLNCGLANTIHLVPSTCEGASAGFSVLPQPSINIYVEKFLSALGGDMRYQHIPGAGAVSFEAMLLHELGHALGLGHPQDCANWSTICPAGADACAVMAGGQTLARDYFMYDDTQALRYAYSVRTAPAESLLEAADLDLGFTAWPIGNVEGQGFFAASSRPVWDQSNMTVVGYRRNTLPNVPLAYDWYYWNYAFTSLGYPHTFIANGPLGVAHDTSSRFATSSVWRNTADGLKWHRRVAVSSRPLVGSTWTTVVSTPGVNALDDTIAGGVSSAFEPRSGVLLTALRSTDGRVLLQDVSGSTFGSPWNTTIKSITTPLIACTTAASPAKNCILVTVEAGKPVTTSSTQRLQWTEFTWNAPTDTWTAGLVHTEPFLMWSDMSLAVHSDGASWEFVVTYQLPIDAAGYQVYALRKAPGEANGFVLFDDLFTSSNQTSFSFVGGMGPYIEAFNFVHP